ncbi:MAG: UDP-N-acetylglucosamine 2-epimerase (non-hydrolyzing) [Myxococcales bacterium]|nr:UDP-N-acetylglucosamine 2-epimerase (non-hydrolyzing) [Myxococcales bacterium]
MFTVLAVFGTRAEAIKFAPLIRELRGREQVRTLVAVTGGRETLVDRVLGLFDIQPDADLRLLEDPSAAPADLATQFANVTNGLAEAIPRFSPDLVVVLGDGITTLSASLVAYYRRIPVAHVEAGLRVSDKFGTFPEEGHRLMVGSIADLHFAPTEHARENLLAEGVEADKICVTGNTGLDALRFVRDRLESMRAAREISLPEIFSNDGGQAISASAIKAIWEVEHGDRRLVLVTGSRPETFGAKLQTICGALSRLSDEYPDDLFVYPVDLAQPLRERIDQMLHDHDNIFVVPPLNYLPFVYLMTVCDLVLTDSGSIQEEAPALGKPVLLMRSLTDRPEALRAGGIKLVGTDAVHIVSAARDLLNNKERYEAMAKAPNPYGQGEASSVIVDRILTYAIERGLLEASTLQVS